MELPNKQTANKQKEPYISPELRIFGTITELTLGSGGASTDSPFAGSFGVLTDPSLLPPQK